MAKQGCSYLTGQSTDWSVEDFEAALASLKNETRQEDTHLPDTGDALTQGIKSARAVALAACCPSGTDHSFCATALDSLFGDYIDLKSMPKNDLDWVGTHLWKDVAQLQGPATLTQVSKRSTLPAI